VADDFRIGLTFIWAMSGLPGAATD